MQETLHLFIRNKHENKYLMFVVTHFQSIPSNNIRVIMPEDYIPSTDVSPSGSEVDCWEIQSVSKLVIQTVLLESASQ